MFALPFILVAALAAPEAEHATLDDRARWRARLRWPDACEAEHVLAAKILESADGRVRAFPLEPGRTLVEVACARGAYQDSLRYYLWDETRAPGEATALSVPTLEPLDDEWEPVERLEAAGESSFDARQRTLTLLTRARGLGDCGSQARYRVQARKLVLLELRGRPCDDGPESAPPPSRWPRVFPK
jgi:hypothetical protein